jgi:hypothetical protein
MERINVPVSLPEETVNSSTSFPEAKTKISEILSSRLVKETDALFLKTIEKVLIDAESTYIFCLSDGKILIAQAEIINNLPVIKVLTETDILSKSNIRAKLLSESLEAHFVTKKKSAEELQKAELKRAAIAKLTPEELTALGLTLS